MFGQTKVNGGAPSAGMGMMLKALGFDPEAFTANMEAAKQAAITTVQNFDRRLVALEQQYAENNRQLQELIEWLKTPKQS